MEAGESILNYFLRKYFTFIQCKNLITHLDKLEFAQVGVYS